MKSKISILFAILISSIALAQSKVGTVNSDYLLSVMPEGKIVVKLTQEYAERLDSVFALKVVAYQNSLNEFRDINDSISQDTKTLKLIEIQKFENVNVLLNFEIFIFVLNLTKYKKNENSGNLEKIKEFENVEKNIIFFYLFENVKTFRNYQILKCLTS